MVGRLISGYNALSPSADQVSEGIPQISMAFDLLVLFVTCIAFGRATALTLVFLFALAAVGVGMAFYKYYRLPQYQLIEEVTHFGQADLYVSGAAFGTCSLSIALKVLG